MRTFLLATAISLGLPGALSSVICDTSQASRINGTSQDQNHAIQSCIDKLCSTGGASQDCGSHLLSVTQFDEGAPAGMDICITHFGGIFNQCFIAENVEGGIAVSNDALYEIHVMGETGVEETSLSNDDQELKGLQARGRTRGGRTRTKSGTRKTRKPNVKKTKSKAKKTKSKSKSKTKPKVPPKSKPKAKSGTRPKSTPKIRPKTKPKKATKPKKNSCQAKKGKSGTTGKKGKKNIRDVVESFLPSYLLPRTTPTGSPSGKGKGKATDDDVEACELKPHYRRELLDQKLVYHYYFDTTEGWQQSPSVKNSPPHVRNVMNKMRSNGFFNVVAFTGKSQKTYCVGKAGPNRPQDVVAKAAAAGGRCLVTNGNFFVLPGDDEMYWQYGGEPINDIDQFHSYSIGFTSTDPGEEKTVGVPPDYQGYYERLVGTDGSSMMCGPSLKDELDFGPEHPEFCQPKPTAEESNIRDANMIGLVNKIYGSIPGSLSHASGSAERLVTVIISPSHKYVFSYTSTRNNRGGLDLNRMRLLIDTFLKEFTTVKEGIANAHQALNMDGGGSVFVNWVKSNGEQHIIAAGKMSGKELGSKRPRTVQTIVKHSALKKRTIWWT
ncbi:uncharacterized protein N0V89_001282 [Didymosphaeria variabile]|uniref:Phosphodiester glycosidase domain-containing protein n=1 Tax=Didymosphaeria variabile TaxID=1932322 RepID=A0A9W8XXT8_9PLEO|nr:uncharacterized protein N0V89_001282 [Didymosphaeria variabile]KAJ4360715.1 hypothetical protein N0V89_001282 [Didymosphaeria variabile]